MTIFIDGSDPGDKKLQELVRELEILQSHTPPAYSNTIKMIIATLYENNNTIVSLYRDLDVAQAMLLKKSIEILKLNRFIEASNGPVGSTH